MIKPLSILFFCEIWTKNPKKIKQQQKKKINKRDKKLF